MVPDDSYRLDDATRHRISVPILGALEQLVEEHDEAIAREDARRQEYPEHVCATEVLIDRASVTADALYAFLMEHGYLVPSSLLDLLCEVARQLMIGHARAQSTEPCESGIPALHDAHAKLHEVLERYRDLVRVLEERAVS